MKHLFLIVFSLFCFSITFSQSVVETQTFVLSPAIQEENLDASRPPCWPFIEYSANGCLHRWSVQCADGTIRVCNDWIRDPWCELLDFINSTRNSMKQPETPTTSKNGSSMITLTYELSIPEKERSNLEAIIDYKISTQEIYFRMDVPYIFNIGQNTYVYQPGLYCIRDGKLILKQEILTADATSTH